jgi:3D (Asp-Asp-Asp) domain-containing protein
MKKSRILISVFLSAALLLSCAFNLVSNSFAHVRGVSSDYLYGRIPEDVDEDESEEDAEYDYLVYGGQNVLLGALDGTEEIELGESGGTVVISYGDEEEAPEHEWATAEIEGSILTVTSELTYTEVTEGEVGLPDSEPADETTDDADGQPAEGDNAEGEAPADAEADEAELQTLDEELSGEEPAPTEQPDETEPPENEDTPSEDNGDDNSDGISEEISRPDEIKITVTSADGFRTATFVLTQTPTEDSSAATLNNSKFYNPTIPIIASAGANKDAVISGFPAKTVCTFGRDADSPSYLLYYDAMPITIPAGQYAVITVPETDSAEGLKLYNGEAPSDEEPDARAADYELSYFELPTVSADIPVVLGDTALILSLPYAWGNAEKPEVVIEKCVTDDDDALSWVAINQQEGSESILCEMYEETSEVSFVSNEAEAGSYRATLTWTDPTSEIILLEYSFPFYVFYPERAEDEQSVAYEYVDGQTHGVLTGGEEIEVIVTYYCSCEICCDEYANGITASGKKAATGMVAMDAKYPFGTKILIDGVMYTVEDRGGAITDNHVDIYMPTHNEALKNGTKVTTATVYLPSDTEESEG